MKKSIIGMVLLVAVAFTSLNASAASYSKINRIQSDLTSLTAESVTTSNNVAEIDARIGDVTSLSVTGITATVDCTDVLNWSITLSTNSTITLTNIPSDYAEINVLLAQDTNGGYTAVFTDAVWTNSYTLDNTTNASAVDIISLKTFDAGTTFYGIVEGQDLK